MSICLCYHDESNFLHERGVCYSTKEKEPCSCGGNPAKCDFYEEVKEKYIHRTNYDRIISKSPEELALFIEECTKGFIEPTRCNKNCLREDCYDCWLDWLKLEFTSKEKS